jgi:hypothetical protein
MVKGGSAHLPRWSGPKLRCSFAAYAGPPGRDVSAGSVKDHMGRARAKGLVPGTIAARVDAASTQPGPRLGGGSVEVGRGLGPVVGVPGAFAARGGT